MKTTEYFIDSIANFIHKYRYGNERSSNQMARYIINRTIELKDEIDSIKKYEQIELSSSIPCDLSYTPKQPIKTAEDILTGVLNECNIHDVSDRFKSIMILAMEEYASQRELPSVNTTLNKTCSFGGFCSWKTNNTVPYCTQSGICNYQK